jgi:ribosomal protein S18 acetylase RimI-like enzyme
MAGFKFLVDTNIVIGLEDAHPVDASFAEFVRLCSENAVGLFVEGANYDDVQRDKNLERRAITLSKLDKFQKLRGLPNTPEIELVKRFGAISSANDLSDVRLLLALEAKAVDFLITQDDGLRRRAARVGIGARVLTIEEALAWVRQTYHTQSVALPDVLELKAYQIDLTDGIFESLRLDYPEFDAWFDKCRQQHRDCWVVQIGKQIAGLVVRKDEIHTDAQTLHPGPKILKISTLKVRDEFRGEKFGELLLKQIFWFAQRNRYDLIYLTVLPQHVLLIELLKFYGFSITKTIARGEFVMEKPMLTGEIPTDTGNAFEFDRLNYPRVDDRTSVRKFCVPIQPDYHRRLFPEIAFGKELPLFPRREFGLTLSPGPTRKPGNTIRKVYLCRASTNRLRAGDLLFFYMSKDVQYEASQSLTTLGVVQQTNEVHNLQDLMRLTAKRSVFSGQELEDLLAASEAPIKVIDFLLVGHLDPTITLDRLLSGGIFVTQPPQSILELDQARYKALRPQLQLGFDL